MFESPRYDPKFFFENFQPLSSWIPDEGFQRKSFQDISLIKMKFATQIP